MSKLVRACRIIPGCLAYVEGQLMERITPQGLQVLLRRSPSPPTMHNKKAIRQLKRTFVKHRAAVAFIAPTMQGGLLMTYVSKSHRVRQVDTLSYGSN